MTVKLRLTRDQVECLLEETQTDSRAALVAYLGELCKDWLDMESALSKKAKKNGRKQPDLETREDLSDK